MWVCVVARNARRAQRLPDIDGELASLLQSRMREADGAQLQSRGETEEVRQRKIDRMAAVRQYEENTTSNTREKASYMVREGPTQGTLEAKSLTILLRMACVSLVIMVETKHFTIYVHLKQILGNKFSNLI